MNLLKVSCELRYAKRMKILDNYETIYEELLKQEAKVAEKWLAPGLRLDDDERKRIMVIDGNRIIIDVEQPPNIGFCKDMIMQFFHSVDEKFNIPEIARWGLRSTWINEYQGEFSELLNEYKNKFFGNYSIAKKADDVGVTFDYDIEDKVKLSVVTGPMIWQQLKEQFIKYEMEEKPQAFMYIAVDMGDMKNNNYSRKYLNDFFTRAMNEGEKMANEVIKQFGSIE